MVTKLMLGEMLELMVILEVMMTELLVEVKVMMMKGIGVT